MDVKRILNKKGWTGRELGILEITNMATLFGQTLNGEKEKPLVESSQLQKMVNGIKDPIQGAMYNNYISIHEWLSIQYNIAQTQLQQAQLQYRTLESFITEAIMAEDVYRYVEKLPVIMTQKQYEETKAERIEAYFTDERGKEYYSDIFDLIEKATSYFVDLLQTNPAKANPLKAIRKKYINEPVKSKLILDRWNEVMGEGYYTLQDGRRSDKMTEEEWQEAITTPSIKKALRDMDTTNGEGTEYTEDIAEARLKERAKVIFSGGTEAEAETAQEKWDIDHGYAVPCEWHYYTDPPTDVTKWDIIEQKLIYEFYPYSFDGEDSWEEHNYTASIKDFAKEFPELVKAMLKEIDKRYFKGEEGISNIPVEEWEDHSWSWRELYDKDFFGVREEAEEDFNVFAGNFRAMINGVAIIRPSDLIHRSRDIDERGYYIEPEIKTSLYNYSLEAFFTDSEDYANNVDIVESSREALLNSYYFLLGYNYTLDRIGELHDVPAISVFKCDLSGLNDRIDALNDLVPVLYRQIKDTNYGDKELQDKKLQVLVDYFQPIDYKSLAIPEKNKEEADKLIEDFSAFKPEETDHFFNLLFVRPVEEEGA